MRQLLLLPCLLISHAALANQQIWTDIEQPYQSRQLASHVSPLKKTQRFLKLDLSKLTELLSDLSSGTGKDRFLNLPLPNGQQMHFKIEPSIVMNPELARRYPHIKTWKIINPDNSAVNGRIDLTPSGFHGLIYTSEGDRVFIDPNGDSDLNQYVSRNASNSHDHESGFNCQVHGKSPVLPEHSPSLTANRLSSKPADSFRTYRIAVAATGEYTQLFGGTKEDALASLVTTINRLNQVFERDLSVHLELVANNDKILYTSPSSDPYSNEDASAMVEENIVNLNAIIGVDNYDIGHVFGTGNTGGLAFLSSACGTYKAGGVTGSNSPSGEAFNIDYVAHEIGHQLGASHTFNGHQLNCSAGNRAADTAVEPGSGSSIMGYAGICGTDNLQSTSDAFFHSVSINQIKTYIQKASGSNCGILSTKSNNNPTVSAGADFTIPAETPFKLTGVASDIDSDTMLHSWEQIDVGSTGGLYADLGDNPLFRTWPPTSEASRYFPRLIDTLNHTSTIGEMLPTTDRKLNFTLLSRDNKGGVSQDNVALNVINTGTAFEVLSQSSSTTFSANQKISVSWEVANTTQPPISCSHVSIGLIDNNGMTVPLVSSTPNDGSHSLTVPANIVSVQNAHMQISCINNIFFAVSEGEIDVLGGDPVISVNSPSIEEMDSGVRNLTFIVSLSVTASENIAVNYEVTDSATSAILKQGTVVITQGSTTANIQVPVAGDILQEDNQIVSLSLQKPLNAQFANESSLLTSLGTIIDDDIATIAANPEPATTTPASSSGDGSSSNDSGGGGSFSLFSIFGLLLLSIRRKIILRIT